MNVYEYVGDNAPSLCSGFENYVDCGTWHSNKFHVMSFFFTLFFVYLLYAISMRGIRIASINNTEFLFPDLYYYVIINVEKGRTSIILVLLWVVGVTCYD